MRYSEFSEVGLKISFLRFLPFLIEETLLFKMPQTAIRFDLPFLFYKGTKLVDIFTLFEAKNCPFLLKNFKTGFLETLFFKSSTSKCYISESFVLRRLGKVSIDQKFYLVLGSGHNSIPQKWDLFRFKYTNFISMFTRRHFQDDLIKTF